MSAFLRTVADRADSAQFPDTAAGLRRAAEEMERLREQLRLVAIPAAELAERTRRAEAENERLRSLLKPACKLAMLWKRWDVADTPLAYRDVLRELTDTVEAFEAAEAARREADG